MYAEKRYNEIVRDIEFRCRLRHVQILYFCETIQPAYEWDDDIPIHFIRNGTMTSLFRKKEVTEVYGLLTFSILLTDSHNIYLGLT